MRKPSFATNFAGETWMAMPAVPPAWEPPHEAARGTTLPGELRPDSDDLFRREGLGAPPDNNAEPYTLQWFLAIEHQRHSRHARWIPQLLEFAKHAGETLLGLGNGLGTDWLQYARHGAKVIACSPVAAEVSLVRRNFELRGLTGRFLHAQPTALPLADASVDVVCFSGLRDETPEPAEVVAEIFRVLKPGGKVLAVVPARYHMDYWRRTLFAWFTSMTRTGQARNFSRRRLRRLFGHFLDHRIHKRQLRRKEVPWCWRWLPLKWLERTFGRTLILKAFKPVTLASTTSIAA